MLHVEHREVEIASEAGLLARQEPEEHRLDRHLCGREIGDARTRLRRGIAGQRRDPPDALEDQVVAGSVVVISERTDAHPHLSRPPHGRAQPEALHHPGSEVLDDDVGALDQPPRHPLARLGPQVEGDRTFVPVCTGEVDTLPADYRVETAGLVPRQRLDFDDVETLVAQRLGRPGTGEHAGEVRDAEGHGAAPNAG